MTETTIRDYCARNPGLEIRDVQKYLYQSAFGCEHLAADEAYALNRIREEARAAREDRIRGVEELDGDFCRLHLNVLDEGLRAETLCRLFLLSADRQENGNAKLLGGLRVLESAAEKGMLPFSADEVRVETESWKQAGFPPVRHSERFRAAYHPAYRVVRKDLARLLPLLQRIDAADEESSLIIGIDGRCASGKTTLAAILRKIYDCNLFHMDDFFLRPEQRTPERFAAPGENVDHERFLEEVLKPLRKGESVFLRRFDCASFTLLDAVEIPHKRVTFVEGSYSMHPELKACFDYRVFLDISPQKQLERLKNRNPGMVERFRNEWIPMEEAYFQTYPVEKEADLCLKEG